MENVFFSGTIEEFRCFTRLEYLRGEIEAERISYREIAELQSLSGYIKPNDVVLLEWAAIGECDGKLKAKKRKAEKNARHFLGFFVFQKMKHKKNRSYL